MAEAEMGLVLSSAIQICSVQITITRNAQFGLNHGYKQLAASRTRELHGQSARQIDPNFKKAVDGMNVLR